MFIYEFVGSEFKKVGRTLFEGKVCIVTGTASGIGLAIAQAFAKENVKVVMSNVNESKIKAESSKIGADYFTSDLSVQKSSKK